ncbi:MAG: MBL fold metallo-hydrolase [Oscillospiraceae bacterium]|nr:MBL fold metallo-hydrolase [Oscillospiraceae bacterium]
MIALHTLASGSEGNCLLLSAGNTHLLLDCGISCRRICGDLRQLGLSLRDISAVLITHTHSDHIQGLETLCKQSEFPLYASAGAARQLTYRLAGIDHRIVTVEPGADFTAGEVAVQVFSLSHDAPGAVDYRFDYGGASVGVLTDSGYVTPDAAKTLQGVELMVLESNHDMERLRSGPYPYFLKARILSERGHLSNADAAAFAAQLADTGTRQFVLAHLSRENNTPALALDAMQQTLRGTDATVDVAPRGQLSRAYVAEGAVCRKSI